MRSVFNISIIALASMASCHTPNQQANTGIPAPNATSALPKDDCRDYYYFRQGKTISWELKSGPTVFNVAQRVKEVAGNKATIESTGTNGQLTIAEVACDGEGIMLDFALANPGKDGPPMKIETDHAASIPQRYPATMHAGDLLPDAKSVMQMEAHGHKMTITSNISNRKVTGEEQVTTAAGTWTALRIVYNVAGSIDMPGMPAGKAMPGSNSTITEWFVPHYGLVKMKSDLFTMELTKVQ